MSEKGQAENALVQEYRTLAADYDNRWAFYVAATVQETLARLLVKEGERVLDVGCGTGVLLAELGRRHPSLTLTGIDPVEEMLEVARTRLPESVSLGQGWAEALPFPNASFDKVLSCSMFHYSRKPQQVLTEIRRVLAPDGALVLTDWCDDFLSCKLCDLWLRLFNKAHYRIYGSGELQAMLEEAGFAAVKVERYKINWLWGLMTALAVPDARE
jgi:ubiquinone/menaquinone biosynthesis C-methylase UbiE